MPVTVVGRVVTPDGVIESGVVTVAGSRIASVGPDPAAVPGSGSHPVHSGHWIVPGFVDIHVHGGGGYTFTTADPEQAQGAAAFHLAHGTTTLLASLVSSPFELTLAATKAYTPLVAEGVIAGIHFEGPYLSTARCGAQNPQFLRHPSIVELTELVAAGAGALRMVTLAPELPGALDAIDLLVRHGIVAAIGHTDATYEQTRAGIVAGATVGTHVFNGMRPPHHRQPGPVFALLTAPSVVCELIADGTHLHDGTLGFAVTVAGPDRTALITDALSAAGKPDGHYDLGGLAVDVADGVARLTRNGSIAGSTLTMDAALRRTVHSGLSIVDACRMASTTPAAAIGLGAEVGALRAGLRADLVELAEDLQVVRVMRGGRWV
jgi:N-acetylglucosamine-6-phosphate deacetylase